MLEGSRRWTRLPTCVWAVGCMALAIGCGDEVPSCADPPPVTGETSFVQVSAEDSFANVFLDGEPAGTFYLDGVIRLDPCDASDCALTVTELDLYSWTGPEGSGLGSMSVCISRPLELASNRGSVLFPGTVEARLEIGGTPSRAINPAPDSAIYDSETDELGLSIGLLDAMGRDVQLVVSGPLMP